MRGARRPLVIAGALLATLLVASAPALAHADLMGAEPQPNTELEDPPARLELSFSEPLEDSYTRVQLVDANGSDHVETFTIPGDDRRSLEAEAGAVPDGVHTVTWRALSSADGHTTSGSYLLAVNASLTGSQGSGDGGDGAGPSPSTSDGQAGQVEEGGPGEALLRGLGFLGASLAAGVPLFVLLARDLPLPDHVRSRWWALAIGGAGVAALATLGLVWALAVRTELALEAALGTTPGQNLGLRALAFAGASGLLSAGARWRETEPGLAAAATGTAAALGGLLLTSLGSHAAAQGVGTGLAIAIDWLHQAAVAFWVAGVAALGLAGWHTKATTAARLIRRFSPLAVASVALIVVTGLLASVDRLTSPSDLVASLYGVALSAKILLLAPLVLLGAYHRYRLLPQLETPGHEEAEATRLRRSAFLELGLMVVVLAAAGFMATTSPPTPLEQRTPYATFDEAIAADRSGPFQPDLERSDLPTLTEAEAANVTLHLLEPRRIDRLDQGDQPAWVALADEIGERARPITDADVEIQAWMPEHGHGTSTPETDPVHVHDGMYEGATHWMMPGAWQLRFDVTLPSGDVLHYRPTVYVEEQADPLDQREPLHAVEEDGYVIETFVSPDPVRVGVQNLTVRVTPGDEPVLPENADVVVNLDAPSGSGEGESLDLERWREDAWTREDAIFTERGDWTVLVALQGKGTYVQTEFGLDVSPP